jgi:hypothetical protein
MRNRYLKMKGWIEGEHMKNRIRRKKLHKSLQVEEYLEEEGIKHEFSAHHSFKLFQMDVKCAFLNGPIKKEVYIEQPPDFEDDRYPDHVYKLSKALYGLKQAL